MLSRHGLQVLSARENAARHVRLARPRGSICQTPRVDAPEQEALVMRMRRGIGAFCEDTRRVPPRRSQRQH